MLIYSDDINAGRDDMELFKRTLVSSGKYDPSILYESPQKKTVSDGDINDPEVEYDFSAVDWSVPSMDEFADFARIQEAMDNTSVMLSGDNEEVFGEWT